MGFSIHGHDFEKDRYLVLHRVEGDDAWRLRVWNCYESKALAAEGGVDLANAHSTLREGIIVKVIGEVTPPPPKPVNGVRMYDE